MEPICDICGKILKESEIKLQRGKDVWRATVNNYFPSNLPSPFNVSGENVADPGKIEVKTNKGEDLWKKLVEINKGEDWGLCPKCHEEVQQFNSNYTSKIQKELTANEKLSIITDMLKEFLNSYNPQTFIQGARKIDSSENVLPLIEIVVKKLIKKGDLDVNGIELGAVVGLTMAIKEIGWGDEFIAPLHIAIQSGEIDLAIQLIENGADPNCVDGNGLSPLMAAVNLGFSTIKTLVNHGANIRYRSSDGQDIFDLLEQEKPDDVEIIKTYLVKVLADQDAEQEKNSAKEEERQIRSKDQVLNNIEVKNQLRKEKQRRKQKRYNLKSRVEELGLELKNALKKLEETKKFKLFRKASVRKTQIENQNRAIENLELNIKETEAEQKVPSLNYLI